MKKNMKGFTLIELLAVIVILAVIALIATPIIMNVINEAREGASKDATFGYAKAVETAIAIKMIDCPKLEVGTIGVKDMTITGCDVTTLPINYKGTEPEKVNVTFNKGTGKLSGKVMFGTDRTFDVETGDKTADLTA